MKRERWRTVFFLIIIGIITLFVRFFFLQSNSATIVLEGDYYQKAFIAEQGIYRIQTFNLDDIYTMVLSASLLLFGNCEMAGVYLNIILQLIAVVCIYFAIDFVANTYVAFLIAAVISLMPFYSDKVYEVSSFNLLILLYAIGLFFIAIMCRGAYMFAFRKKISGQEIENIAVENEEEQTGVITLDDIIGESSSSSESEKKNENMQAEDTLKEESVPAGMKEIILDEETAKKKVKFIENPLPVPKRHERKEMDFAIELCDENEDYDIKDISGMDFFDIE